MMWPMTLANRIAAAMKARGLNQNQLARATGLTAGYLDKVQRRNSRTMVPDNVGAIAKTLGVSVAWLTTGEGEGPDGLPAAPEPAPTPPPAKSDTRRIATHYDDPEVEGYFASAIRQSPDEPTGKQIVTSKTFLREKMTRMVEGVDMVDFALGVIEAVQALDRQGQLGEPEDPATHTRILAYLTAQSRARRTPREMAMAEARKHLLIEESAEPEDDPPSANLPKVVPRKTKGR